ncbi:MAG TPA: hypothetical protein VIP28_11050 [Nocardioides sp.]
MTQTQVPRRKRFFETTLGGFVIAGAALVAIAVLVYVTQYANPSYEERLGDAELECADLIEFGGTAPDTGKFEDCVDYEMGR